MDTREGHTVEGNAPKQALRLRRSLAAMAMCLAHSLFVIVLYQLGALRLDLTGVVLLLAVIWLGNLVIIGLFKLGLNLRFEDPSLTLGQIIWAVSWVIVSTYFMDSLRPLMLMVIQVVVVFGSFRLRAREFFSITLFAVVGYALVIVCLLRFQPQAVSLGYEVLTWLGFTIVSLCLNWLGVEVSNLRRQLKKGNVALHHAMTRIHNLAVTDELTGTFNRRHIMDVLARKKAACDEGLEAFTVVFMDLDHFKRVNDTYGHVVGDQVLSRFAKIVDGCIRGGDALARYGGEEFLLMMAQTELAPAARVATRIRQVVADTDCGDLAEGLTVTVSMGLAQYREGENIDQLLARADVCLYRAKAEGRNRVVAQEDLET